MTLLQFLDCYQLQGLIGLCALSGNICCTIIEMQIYNLASIRLSVSEILTLISTISISKRLELNGMLILINESAISQYSSPIIKIRKFDFRFSMQLNAKRFSLLNLLYRILFC